MLEPGTMAPDFAVGATSLHAILRERGVILFFFPAAFTPG
jgi:peroxiredoxin